MILNSILLFLAAFFNAVMDKTETVISFYSSRFKKLNPKFWCKPISANKDFAPYTKYRVDAWHLSKSLMIICLCVAISDNIWQFLIYGFIWNLTFNLMYNKALKKI